MDGNESPVHTEEVPLPASPTSPKAGGKAEGKAEGKMVVNKVVVKVGGRSEEKAEEGPIVPSAMVFRPFPNPRQPMIPTDEPPPAPLPPTTRRTSHALFTKLLLLYTSCFSRQASHAKPTFLS